MKTSQNRSIDIFQLLEETSEERRREKRERLLQSVGVKEFFEEGNIRINTSICDGVECKLCIEACPTNALYWRYGRVEVVEELCVFCTACVLSCMVDDCIKVKRKRPNGEVEEFSTPEEALTLLQRINSRKTHEMVRRLFPTVEAYLRRYLR